MTFNAVPVGESRLFEELRPNNNKKKIGRYNAHRYELSQNLALQPLPMIMSGYPQLA